MRMAFFLLVKIKVTRQRKTACHHVKRDKLFYVVASGRRAPRLRLRLRLRLSKTFVTRYRSYNRYKAKIEVKVEVEVKVEYLR